MGGCDNTNNQKLGGAKKAMTETTFFHEWREIQAKASCNYDCKAECNIGIYNRCPRNIEKVRKDCGTCEISARCDYHENDIDGRKLCFYCRSHEHVWARAKDNQQVIWDFELKESVSHLPRCPYTPEYRNWMAKCIVNSEWMDMFRSSDFQLSDEEAARIALKEEYQNKAIEIIKRKYKQIPHSPTMCSECPGYCELDGQHNLGEMMKRGLLSKYQSQL